MTDGAATRALAIGFAPALLLGLGLLRLRYWLALRTLFKARGPCCGECGSSIRLWWLDSNRCDSCHSTFHPWLLQVSEVARGDEKRGEDEVLDVFMFSGPEGPEVLVRAACYRRDLLGRAPLSEEDRAALDFAVVRVGVCQASCRWGSFVAGGNGAVQSAANVGSRSWSDAPNGSLNGCTAVRRQPVGPDLLGLLPWECQRRPAGLSGPVREGPEGSQVLPPALCRLRPDQGPPAEAVDREICRERHGPRILRA